MLSKKELRKLPVPQLPKKRTDAVYRASGVEYIIRSGFALDGKMLIVAFYSRESAAAGFTLPTAVVYQTKDDFVTLFSKEGKRLWRKSRIMGLLNITEAKKKLVFLGQRDEARAKSFLAGVKRKYEWRSDDTSSRLGYLQDNILDKRREAIYALQYLRMIERINIAPALPEDFQDWVQTGAMIHHQYIFYKRRGKRKADGYCSACKTAVVIEKNLPKHLGEGVCPSCGLRICFRAIGRSVNLTDEVYTSVMQETGENEYVLRFYENIRCFKPAPDAARFNGATLSLIPSLCQAEVARVYFDGEGDVTGQYKCQGEIWRKTNRKIVGDNVDWEFRMYYRYFWHYWFEPGYLYPHNLIPLFDKLGISYKLIDSVCRGPINVTTPILQNVKYPYLESLAAMGYKQLHEDILKYGVRFAKSSRSGKLHECLGVRKSFMEIAQKHRLEVKDFDLAASFDAELTEEDFLWLASMRPSGEFMSFFLQFCTMTEIRHYLAGCMRLMDRYDKYNCKWDAQMTWWRDYLQMCFRLGYDMSDRKILFPYNLKQAHDLVMRMSDEKPNPKWDAKIAGCYERLANIYSFERDGYLIRPPKSYVEFAIEGNRLFHCVCRNQYYINHVKGTNLIFFVRKAEEPENPLYTIEYIPKLGKVQQFYGYRHSHPSSEARAFVQDWKAFLRESIEQDANQRIAA